MSGKDERPKQRTLGYYLRIMRRYRRDERVRERRTTIKNF